VLLWYPHSAIALSDPPAARPAAFYEEVDSLTAWLQAKKCPNEAVHFVNAAETYGLDYRVLPVIWLKESGCGRHQLNGNGFGYEPSGSLKKFSSTSEAIYYVTQKLTEHPYAGKTTKGIVYTYNSVGEPSYYETFSNLIQQMQ
jgi:hypothetical protein